jgi:ribokinase
LAIGNINVDLICSVPRLPHSDDKILISNLDIIPGGAASNFAVGLKRLGSPVAIFAHVGDDRNGRQGLKSLHEEGIDISRVKIAKEEQTGFVMILVDPLGQTIKIAYREANKNLSIEDITPDILKGVSLVHLASVPADIALHVAKNCNSLNIPCSIDFGAELMDEKEAVLRSIVNNYSYIFLNQIAFERTFGKKPSQKAFQKALQDNFQILNVTLGDQGSYILTHEEIIKIPIWEVQVVDTTGAGDAYAAGFIHYYQQNESLETVGKYAAACAALQISKANARDGMPTKIEVEAFINQRTIEESR